MKFNSLLFLIFFLAFINNSKAQSLDKSWLFSVNSNIINLQGNNVAKGLNFGGPGIGLSRYIVSGLSLGAQFSLGNVSNLNDPGFPFDYSSLDGFVKVNIFSGIITPHIIGGYGFSKFSDGIDRVGFFPSTETSRTIFGGLGFSMSLNQSLAINLQSTYRGMNENDLIEAGIDYEIMLVPNIVNIS